MPRSATAAGESGSPSTTGMPWSAPSRSRVSSGIWPSSGTSAPIARVSESATLWPPPEPKISWRGAVGQLEPGHVLDDADDPLVGLQRDRAGALGDLGGGVLRGGDDEDLGAGDQLGDRDRDVAGARRQVEQQHVEVAPEDVGEELLQGAVQHRPAPDDRLVAGDEHADRDDLHAVRERRQDHVVDLGRAAARRRACGGSRSRRCRRRRRPTRSPRRPATPRGWR